MCDDKTVRTTLELDDDLAHVARQLASQREMTMGQVVSELMRKALEPKAAPRARNGVPLFTPKPGARKPHLALVNRLRDGE
jgi:hypothetical protein